MLIIFYSIIYIKGFTKYLFRGEHIFNLTFLARIGIWAGLIVGSSLDRDGLTGSLGKGWENCVTLLRGRVLFKIITKRKHVEQ